MKVADLIKELQKMPQDAEALYKPRDENYHYRINVVTTTEYGEDEDVLMTYRTKRRK